MQELYNLFDFDGTIVESLNINYDEMKIKLKEVLCFEGELKPMFDIIMHLCYNNNVLKKKCFDIIDEYEINALLKCNGVNDNIIDIYNKSKYKIIISRNGEKVISAFFHMYHLKQPDFISCRDNCYNLKPHVDQVTIIFEKFPFMNINNIVIFGDSWHDEELSRNINCKFINITD